MKMQDEKTAGFRGAIKLVALLNLGYFIIEFIVARKIGSVSLFADSVDFLEDGLVNILILVAMGWSPVRRARVGMVLAGLILVPGLSTLWTAWQKLFVFVPPSPISLSLTAAGAFCVNLFCAVLLTRYRHYKGSLARAAILSARNDVLANGAIIVVGLITFFIASAWPDMIVGLAIAWLNMGAAKEVYMAAREEHRTALS